MHKIEAIIRPFKLEDVKNALTGMGLEGVTMTEVKSTLPQSEKERARIAKQFHPDFHPKYKLEIFVSDARLPDVKSAIIHAAQTGKIGDGRIFILPVENAIRIRTREFGESAL